MVYSLIIADFIMIIASVLSYNHLPPQIPLYYTHTWGEDQLADIWQILIIPIFMHIFYFANNWFKKKYIQPGSFIYKLIDGFNIFIVISFTFVFLKIILLTL